MSLRSRYVILSISCMCLSCICRWVYVLLSSCSYYPTKRSIACTEAKQKNRSPRIDQTKCSEEQIVCNDSLRPGFWQQSKTLKRRCLHRVTKWPNHQSSRTKYFSTATKTLNHPICQGIHNNMISTSQNWKCQRTTTVMTLTAFRPRSPLLIVFRSNSAAHLER